MIIDNKLFTELARGISQKTWDSFNQLEKEAYLKINPTSKYADSYNSLLTQIKSNPKEVAMKALNELEWLMSMDGYNELEKTHEESRFGKDFLEFSIQDWCGCEYWIYPDYEEDELDEDCLTLRIDKREKLEKLRAEVENKYNVKIKIKLGEKNWIYAQIFLN